MRASKRKRKKNVLRLISNAPLLYLWRDVQEKKLYGRDLGRTNSLVYLSFYEKEKKKLTSHELNSQFYIKTYYNSYKALK